MFLVDSALAGSDWNGVISAIERIFERAGAELISLKKWDDRRLAYEIDHKDRGTYILTYFRVDGSKIQSIERDVRLSDDLMRVLILNAEVMSSEDMEKETPMDKVQREKTEEAAKISENAQEPQEPVVADVSSKAEQSEESTLQESESFASSDQQDDAEDNADADVEAETVAPESESEKSDEK
jgi:small subunit ribosomal protein S6